MAKPGPNAKPPSQWATQLNFKALEEANGLTPGLLQTVMTIESNGDPDAISRKKDGTPIAYGPFQFIPATAARYGVTNPHDTAQAAAGAAKYLGDLKKRYGGREDRALAAYNTGEGNMELILAGQKEAPQETVNYVKTAVRLNSNVRAQVEKGKADGEDTLKADGRSAASLVGPQNVEGDAVDYQPFNYYATKSAVELEAAIDYSGLDQPGPLVSGLVGNPHLRRMDFPAVFRIRLSETDSRFLTKSKDSDIAVEIPLNVSLKTMNTRSAHIVTKRNTRTGFHISLWGQDIDTISGTGSTGIFMNQLGLASMMSTNGSLEDLGLSKVPELAKLLKSETNNKTGWYQGGMLNAWNDLWTSKADIDARKAADMARTSARANVATDKKLLRVASQDAFAEILNLFKFNGITRFRTTSDKDAEQLGVATWGPSSGGTVGISDAMFQARRGDVMSRGYVVLKLKGRTYLGYFKSLNFTMDAEKPYTWDFEFSFKVLRSIRVAYAPR